MGLIKPCQKKWVQVFQRNGYVQLKQQLLRLQCRCWLA